MQGSNQRPIVSRRGVLQGNRRSPCDECKREVCRSAAYAVATRSVSNRAICIVTFSERAIEVGTVDQYGQPSVYLYCLLSCSIVLYAIPSSPILIFSFSIFFTISCPPQPFPTLLICSLLSLAVVCCYLLSHHRSSLTL